MKKVILSLTILLAVISLAACSLNSKTGIQFTQLPDAIYEQKVDINENEVNELLGQIKVKVNGTEYALTEKSLKVSGFSVETLSNPGSYTLTVTYDSLSVSYNYTVVAAAAPVVITTEAELIAAGINGGVYELANDIVITKGSSLSGLSTSGFVIKESITLYGNGYKIHGAAATRFVNVANIENKKVSLFDLSIVCESKEDSARALQIQNSRNVELLLDNVELVSNPEKDSKGNYALNIPAGNENITVNIKNSTITGWAAINCYSNYSTYNIEDSVLNGENNSDGWNFGVIVIDGGSIDDEDGNGNNVLAGTAGISNVFKIKNCEINAIENTVNKEFVVSTQYSALLNEIYFENCNFNYNHEFWKETGVGNKVYIDGNLQK